MLESNIALVEVLLLVAGIVAMLSQRLRVPYTVGLVAAGSVLAMLQVPIAMGLSKELIFTAFLPPLIFEATLHLKWPELRRDLLVVCVLASVGVVLSAAVTASGMHWLAGWSWPMAWIFGALIAATDPVSVIATFKESGVKGRLRLLMESEALLNDGVAAVAFSVALTFASGAALTWGGVSWDLVQTVIGGMGCGALVAAAVLLIAGRTQDHLVEITLTTVAAYGSFLVAEHFHFSGVLATLVAGLMIGNLGPRGAISERGRDAVLSFWDYATFVVNSLIFMLIGLEEARFSFGSALVPAAIAIVLVILGRAAAIFPCALAFRGSRWRISAAHQAVLFWGGLRGAMALALALGIPATLNGRDEIVVVAFAVVAFSVVVQGLTMMPLLRRVGEIGLR